MAGMGVEDVASTSTDVLLDPRIQLYVLLPITIAGALMGLLRRSLTAMFIREPATNIVKTRDANILTRSSRLRVGGHAVAPEQFLARRHFFVAPETGALVMPSKPKNTMAALMNPESLANQVMGVVTGIVPQMILGTWARYLFAGIVVCRLPFPLSPGFRSMLHSGIENAGQNLDVSYVSSLSWYLLNIFGNAGLLALITEGDDSLHVPVPSVASQVAMNVGLDKVFANERGALIAVKHDSILPQLEDGLLELPPTICAATE